MGESFGLMFKNTEDDRVILDSEFVRLTVTYRGRYSGSVLATTYFPSAITTQEQPFVFIRPDATSGTVGLTQLQVFGSPGNWQGFTVRVYQYTNVPPNGRYFVAGFESRATSDFGLRLFDAGSKVLFDSGTPSALFVRSSQSWSYAGSDRDAQGVTRNFYNAPFRMDEDEYLLINTLGMGTCGSENMPRATQCYWAYTSGVITAVSVVAVGNSMAFGVPVMVAKLIG